jgi:hypothetical protein
MEFEGAYLFHGESITGTRPEELSKKFRQEGFREHFFK